MIGKRKTLFSAKKDGSVPTGGIYVKNISESAISSESDINFHRDAESKTKELFSFLNLEKDNSSETSVDLKGMLIIFIEVERDFATKVWTQYNNFPYALINIPTEKKRHFMDHRGNSFYLKYNSTIETSFILYGEDIVKYSKEQNMEANHSGHISERTFLRIDKKYALFFNLNDTEKVKKWILLKMAEGL